MKKVTVYVGLEPDEFDNAYDWFVGSAYYKNADEFYTRVLRALDCYDGDDSRPSMMPSTNDPRVVFALRKIHKEKLADISFVHSPSGDVFELDVNGEFIQPWPDNFFDIQFHIIFDMLGADK